MKQQQFNETIQEKILSQMKKYGTNWLQGYKNDLITGRSHNKFTGTQYRGINAWLLYFSSLNNGYETKEYGTAKNWMSLGHNIKKGEKGHHILFQQWKEKESKEHTDDDGNPLVDMYCIYKNYVVFNADQVDGYEVKKPDEDALKSENERLQDVDAYVFNTGAKIIYGSDGGFYSPSRDEIHMPNIDNYVGTDTSNAIESFYGTQLHELAHWTGHESRLNRKITNRFGTTDYAYEELVAECSSALLSGALGISSEPRPDHAKYLNSWMTAIKDNPKVIITAFGKASKVVDYLDGLQDKKEMVA